MICSSDPEGHLQAQADAEMPPPALTQVLDGLLASLGREPTEAELRAAAHSLTVRADRIALARPAYRGA